MTDVGRAKEWVGNNGYFLQELDGGRLGYYVVSRETNDCRALLDNDAELIAFARSKGWGGEG
jgi:hypothetical protein